MSTDEIVSRTRLLENDIKVMILPLSNGPIKFELL